MSDIHTCIHKLQVIKLEILKLGYFQSQAGDWLHARVVSTLPSASLPPCLALLLLPWIENEKPGTASHPSLQTFFSRYKLGWALTGSSGPENSSLRLEIWLAGSLVGCEQSSWQYGRCSIRKGLFQLPARIHVEWKRL